MSEQTGHTPPPHLKLPVWYQEESDVYTHHIRDQNKGMIVCSFGQDSSGEAEEKARYFVGAVNSHATLAEENARLRKALLEISSYDECLCDHSDENCCIKVGEHCDHCLAQTTLAALEG